MFHQDSLQYLIDCINDLLEIGTMYTTSWRTIVN